MDGRLTGHRNRNKGIFFIVDPAWIHENREDERITRVKSILLDIKDIKWVEFLENTWEREWVKNS